jgi:hypothetical protein
MTSELKLTKQLPPPPAPAFREALVRADRIVKVMALVRVVKLAARNGPVGVEAQETVHTLRLVSYEGFLRGA